MGGLKRGGKGGGGGWGCVGRAGYWWRRGVVCMFGGSGDKLRKGGSDGKGAREGGLYLRGWGRGS